jgi:hypothetical protein
LCKKNLRLPSKTVKEAIVGIKQSMGLITSKSVTSVGTSSEVCLLTMGLLDELSMGKPVQVHSKWHSIEFQLYPSRILINPKQMNQRK